MRIVLDTQAWLCWLHDPSQLSAEGRRRLKREMERDSVLVSAMSIWEVATKARQGKLVLPMELDAWLERARSYRGVRIESVRPDDAIESTRLPGSTKRFDGVDRLIVALARRHGALLMTRDPNLRAYSHVRTAW